ncbi:proline-rich protein 32 [Pteronotus mesoamericanus]|uniref:proline-rich protein 32 n=1 Tax=Pteronotus mesoamericanus TaxID=1884717 RepID=UPI0023EBAAC3|nr:proline-rich protein 32 [Pteronotus parnellii mesoamericanus]
MANTDCVPDGRGPLLIELDADDSGNQQPRCVGIFRSVNPGQMDDVKAWGKPREPLRRPFNLRTHLATKKPEPPKKTTSDVSVDSSRAPNRSDGPVPAVVEDSRATAEVKSAEGPAGWRGMGPNPIHVSREFCGVPPSVIMGGIRLSSGDTWRGGNTGPSVPLPQGPGFFPPRGPPVGGPLCNPTARLGIMMPPPPENWRMAYPEGGPPVRFPPGGPRFPMEGGPRPITFPCSIAGFPPSAAIPGPPRSSLIPTMPFAFAPPQIIRPQPPLPDTDFPSWCKKRMEDLKK